MFHLPTLAHPPTFSHTLHLQRCTPGTAARSRGISRRAPCNVRGKARKRATCRHGSAGPSYTPSLKRHALQRSKLLCSSILNKLRPTDAASPPNCITWRLVCAPAEFELGKCGIVPASRLYPHVPQRLLNGGPVSDADAAALAGRVRVLLQQTQAVYLHAEKQDVARRTELDTHNDTLRRQLVELQDAHDSLKQVRDTCAAQCRHHIYTSRYMRMQHGASGTTSIQAGTCMCGTMYLTPLTYEHNQDPNLHSWLPQTLLANTFNASSLLHTCLMYTFIAASSV